jgi:hypothetical protein
MPQMMHSLSARMSLLLVQLQPLYLPAGEKTNVADAVPKWVMHATLETLFGKAFVDSIPVDEFMKSFDDFDAWFEVLLSSNP